MGGWASTGVRAAQAEWAQKRHRAQRQLCPREASVCLAATCNPQARPAHSAPGAQRHVAAGDAERVGGGLGAAPARREGKRRGGDARPSAGACKIGAAGRSGALAAPCCLPALPSRAGLRARAAGASPPWPPRVSRGGRPAPARLEPAADAQPRPFDVVVGHRAVGLAAGPLAAVGLRLLLLCVRQRGGVAGAGAWRLLLRLLQLRGHAGGHRRLGREGGAKAGLGRVGGLRPAHIHHAAAVAAAVRACHLGAGTSLLRGVGGVGRRRVLWARDAPTGSWAAVAGGFILAPPASGAPCHGVNQVHGLRS